MPVGWGHGCGTPCPSNTFGSQWAWTLWHLVTKLKHDSTWWMSLTNAWEWDAPKNNTNLHRYEQSDMASVIALPIHMEWFSHTFMGSKNIPRHVEVCGCVFWGMFLTHAWCASQHVEVCMCMIAHNSQLTWEFCDNFNWGHLPNHLAKSNVFGINGKLLKRRYWKRF